jgi:mRNA-degrading endonuclease RelE of RelBE toxin-antitoxin system
MISAVVAPASYEAFREPRVLKAYQKLPAQVRELADKKYALLKQDPLHPSLRFKKVGKVWSLRVGVWYRALAAESGDDLVWFWIGSHADYDALIR